jgi:hypothetical protein
VVVGEGPAWIRLPAANKLENEDFEQCQVSSRINEGCALVHSIKRGFRITQVCWTRVYPVDFQTLAGSKGR